MEDNGRTVMTPAEYESYYEENLAIREMVWHRVHRVLRRGLVRYSGEPRFVEL